MAITIEVATVDDCAAIEQLIGESARGLGTPDYTDDEIEAALKGVLGLDTQLVRDSSYFLVYVDGVLAGCGGWSFRATLFGSDDEGSRDAALLDPARDAARIRAFFVRPRFARRGIGSMIMERCEREARNAGFRSLTLGATLPGERLYLRYGFTPADAFDYDLGNGLSMKIIPMSKSLSER